MPSPIVLANLRHPRHSLMSLEWDKYRLAFEGGAFFKARYLKKFSTRESDADFNTRRDITHVPAHAKAAILDVRNAIFKSMVDITRKDGPDSYSRAVVGLDRGVDGKGNTMNGFIGQVILPELLVLGRVGVYVDKPQIFADRLSLADARRFKPYLYHYQAEDIFSWHFDAENRLDSVLLRDHTFTVDDVTGVINGERENFRLLKLVEVDGRQQVELTLFGSVGRERNASTAEILQPPMLLDLPEIPFVIMELDSSLMTDIADYQIGMLNLASSDINYAIKSNIPFYTEQFLPGAELPHLRPSDVGGTGASSEAEGANARQQKTGTTQGRRYPMGTERPAFIHPSAEPLRASMELQDKMQREIRQLINLSLSNIRSISASAESKEEDNRGLEGGLANIGLELEFGERNIGRIWWLYESLTGGEITVKYPSAYNLRTDSDRRKEAEELRKILPTVPSASFQKQTTMDIINIMQGHKVSLDELQVMYQEVKDSTVIVTDPDIIKQDHEAGFVSTATASQLRGYPEAEHRQAAIDHAERAARIVTAQMSARDRLQARGVPALDANTDSGHVERQAANDTTMQQTTADRTRGEGNA